MDIKDIARMKKEKDLEKPAIEIAKIIQTKPELIISINCQEYSSEHFTIYVPAVQRIKQYNRIDVYTEDPNPLEFRTNEGWAVVDIGDLDLIPDDYEMQIKVGDLVAVADRGNTFIILTRLVEWNRTNVIHPPPNRPCRE